MGRRREEDDDEGVSLRSPLLGDGERGSEDDEVELSPEERKGIISALFFSWLNPLVNRGVKKPLEMADLYPVTRANRGANTRERFAKEWQRQQVVRDGDGSLYIVFLRAHGWTLGSAYFLKFLQILVNYSRPILLQNLLDVISEGGETRIPNWLLFLFRIVGKQKWCEEHLDETTLGYTLAALIALAAVLQSLFQQHFLYRAQKVGMRFVISLTSAIYGKAMRLSAKSRADFETGQILNMIGADTSRLWSFLSFSMDSFWSAPMQIGIAVFLLIRLLGGWPLLAGLSVLIVSVPITFVNGKIISRVQKLKMAAKDDRVSKLNEAVSGIKVVKCMAWEDFFETRIGQARTKELKRLLYGLLCYVVIMTLFLSVPLLITLAIFGCYVIQGNTLTAVVAFPAIAVLNQLRLPLTQLPDAISRIAEMNVSLRRIKRLLVAEELPAAVVEKSLKRQRWQPAFEYPREGQEGEVNGESKGLRVWVQGGYFSYGAEEAILSGVSMAVEEGSLCVVTGVVGSGKTSLLLSLLGEMKTLAGQVRIQGTVSYVAQTAFIINGTVKDNILFGAPYDHLLYLEVLEACCLNDDLTTLPSGDETEIGESGVNLSGGQKQRISLARAVYKQSDVYLFDDPLSAVDAHVGDHIYHKCVLGTLRKKTRVLVTHGLAYMREASQVLVVEGGEIRERGHYKELTKSGSNSILAELARKYESSVDELSGPGAKEGEAKEAVAEEDGEEEDFSSPSLMARRWSSRNSSFSGESGKGAEGKGGEGRGVEPAEASKLVEDEGRQRGSVAKAIYVTYLGAAGGIPMILTILSVSFFASLIPIASQWWISDWTEDRLGWSQRNYLNGFAGLIFAAVAVYLLRGFATIAASYKAARHMHDNVVAALMRVPLSFFHVTPKGRIMNRCSNDMETVDEQAGPMMANFLNQLTTITGSLVSVMIASYWFGVALPPTAWLYYLVAVYYVSSSRELRRLSSVHKSPIFKHFSESLTGATTIRAYGDLERFEEHHIGLLDEYMRPWWLVMMINRWLSVRLDLIGGFLTASAAYAVLILHRYNLGTSMDAGKAGFAISQTMSVTAVLGWTVMIYGQLEMTAVSIERVMEYCGLKPEPPAVIEDNRPPPGWPTTGQIEIQNYSMAYREGLPFVLRGVSLKVLPMEKVGICGRTGSGKSSLLVALLRLADRCKGRIVIDGVDIASIGVKDLREKISIIPQEGTMFLGTIRFNIDPASKHTDAQIWECLEMVGLKATVQEMAGKLDYKIGEEGANVSQGQRQLICVARAILRQNRVILLDEATASVDVETDHHLQIVLRSVFASCTMLTIAHRMHTISDSNRILVLDNGSVAEFDSPSTLLSRKSLYRSLVEKSQSAATDDGKAG